MKHNTSTLSATGSHSVIAGGNTNTITGACSAILGGANNNDAGLANAHIVGSGINAVNANSLHINGLWANGIPGPGTAAGPNTVFYDFIPSLPFPYNACKILMIV